MRLSDKCPCRTNVRKISYRLSDKCLCRTNVRLPVLLLQKVQEYPHRLYHFWTEAITTEFPDAYLLLEHQDLDEHRCLSADRPSENTAIERSSFMYMLLLADWLMANPTTLGGPGVKDDSRTRKSTKRSLGRANIIREL